MKTSTHSSTRRVGPGVIVAVVLALGMVEVGAQTVEIKAILAPEGYQGLDIAGLNNLGQLAGSYVSPGGTQVAFRWQANTFLNVGDFGDSSYAKGLNNLGMVCGTSTDANWLSHGFLYDTNGVLQDMGIELWPSAINDRGQVAGSGWGIPGFLYANSNLITWDTLGGSYGTVYGLNNHGHAVGYSWTEGDADYHACLFDGTQLVDLTPNLNTSMAYAINDAGQVVGDYASATGTRAFLKNPNQGPMDISPSDATHATADLINGAGHAVGVYQNSATYTRSFVYRDGQTMDLGNLGGSSTEALDINEAGQIVGVARDPNGLDHAFLWENGRFRDLNEVLDPASGWYLLRALYINDAGQVAGIGLQGNAYTWFLLSLGNTRPPVANAGPDQTVECPGPVLLDGSASTDPDGDQLTYEWFSGGTSVGTAPQVTFTLQVGVYEFKLVVTDSKGQTGEDTVKVTVTDTTPPVVTCPGGVKVAANASCQAAVPNFLADTVVTDNAGTQGLAVTQNPPAGTSVAAGVHEVTITATDASGNASTCTTIFEVTDSTPPVIQGITANPNTLVNNDAMVPVTLLVNASDTCGGATFSKILEVTSAEIPSASGVPAKVLERHLDQDQTSPDWIITGDLALTLRAEASKFGDGRIYTITVECRDGAGNVTTGSVLVTVPVSNGNPVKTSLRAK